MALASRFRAIFGARAATPVLEAETAGQVAEDTRPDEPGDAERTEPAPERHAAHPRGRKSVASGAKMVVTQKIPLGTNGTNHIVVEDAQLTDGACTVELSRHAAFTTEHHYKVFVTPHSGSATYHVVRESGSSFTIRSSSPTDTAVVSFLAIGD